ncbi:SLBB domain-containing protein [Candidatus Margulisiibacteriota bacterium]
MKKIVCILGIIFIATVGMLAADIVADPFAPVQSQVSNAPVFQAGTVQPGYQPQTAFSGINPIAPDEYQLGAGDQIAIHVVIGENVLNLDYKYTINPDGSIFFPNLQEIKLAGLTVGQAKAELSQLIRKKYRNQRIMVSLLLVQPRKISVYLVGQVNVAGIHQVYATSRISEVIAGTGGAMGGGSVRNVNIIRGGKKIEVDLYKIYREGNIDKDIEIKNGDIIEIPLAHNQVSITGGVNRPGSYEVKEGERLRDLLLMAGNLRTNASLGKVIYLKRKKGEDEYENIKLDLHKLIAGTDETVNIRLINGDIINIPSIEEFVYVQGDVGNPGRLGYVPGKKLSDYLNVAGGALARADLGNVTIARQVGGKAEIIKIDAYKILKLGEMSGDIEINGGDVINVPANFFYVNDFMSFSNIVLTTVALYNVLTGR